MAATTFHSVTVECIFFNFILLQNLIANIQHSTQLNRINTPTHSITHSTLATTGLHATSNVRHVTKHAVERDSSLAKKVPAIESYYSISAA